MDTTLGFGGSLMGKDWIGTALEFFNGGSSSSDDDQEEEDEQEEDEDEDEDE